MTCGCFPYPLYPLVALLCCAKFEGIDENQNVGKPLAQTDPNLGGAPVGTEMAR